MTQECQPFTPVLTVFRIASACADGVNTDFIAAVLMGRQPELEKGQHDVVAEGHIPEYGHVRAIVRASRVCISPTPLRYYATIKRPKSDMEQTLKRAPSAEELRAMGRATRHV